MWPDHCVQGTRGAEIEDGVRERLKSLGGVVVKKVNAGSGRPAGSFGIRGLIQGCCRQGEDSEVDAYSAFETRCTGAHADQSQVAKLLTGESPEPPCRRQAASRASAAHAPLSYALADHQITSVYVVGLATDYCVRATALAALQAAGHAVTHWTVTVIEEACRGVDAKKSLEVLDELRRAGARVVSIEDDQVRALRKA